MRASAKDPALPIPDMKLSLPITVTPLIPMDKNFQCRNPAGRQQWANAWRWLSFRWYYGSGFSWP